MRSLQLSEARDRFDLLEVTSYDVTLDLRGEETFTSSTVIEVTSQGGATFLDLKPVSLEQISLDGTDLPAGALSEGRYPLTLSAGVHRIEVTATMPFRNDGEGLHRAVDPSDGRTYVYQMSFMSAAPSVFACFDQPDLKARYTVHVTAQADWTVIANAAGSQVEPGRWEFERSRPLSTYFVSLVAGPYHRITDHHDGIDLGLLSRASMAGALETDAAELFTVTRQCFDEFHRLFGIRYAFGKYDQAFVPEFNAGAMENPGCVTFRDPLLFTTKVPRSLRVQRAATVAHEMAHQWFGNLVTPKWWDDLWLNEAFAEYMGNRVTAEVTEFDDALVWAAVARRNWGLTADARPSTHPVAGTGAQDADAALQDFDGISYAKGHAVLTQLARQVGDEVFFAGVRDHFTRHRFGNATMADLFGSWEAAGAGDLGPWANAWLRSAGLDRIDLDRGTGTLVRTPPSGDPVERAHLLGTATWTGSGWERAEVTVSATSTSITVPAGAPIVLDPDAGADGEGAGAIVHEKLMSVVPDPATATARLHAAFLGRAETAEPGSDLQLAAVQAATSTAPDPRFPRALLTGEALPGLVADSGLRWRALQRLAGLGATDLDELDRELTAENTTKTQISYAWCRARLPSAESKSWAWQRFTGEMAASNYEIEAIGTGMWQRGREDLLAPYVERYFAEVAGTTAVRAGWGLADAALFFYPITAVTPDTLARTDALLADPALNRSLRRILVDAGDELRCRLAARERYGAA